MIESGVWRGFLGVESSADSVGCPVGWNSIGCRKNVANAVVTVVVTVVVVTVVVVVICKVIVS